MRNKLISPILLFVSFLQFAGAGYFYFTAKSFLAQAISTEGKVIELVRKHSSEGNDTFAPVFQFRDDATNIHTVESNSSSYPAAFEIGESVTVLYLKEDPKDAKIDAFFEIWGASTILFGMSVLTGFMAVCFFFFKRR